MAGIVTVERVKSVGAVLKVSGMQESRDERSVKGKHNKQSNRLGASTKQMQASVRQRRRTGLRRKEFLPLRAAYGCSLNLNSILTVLASLVF
jgi:hypothetical protein